MAMSVLTAAVRFTELLKQHAPQRAAEGWKAVVNSRCKSRLGQCNFTKRKVEISAFHLQSDDAKIVNTMLHEIAHAIAGHKAGHGPEWVAVAKRIGCNANRCTAVDESVRVQPQWRLAIKHDDGTTELLQTFGHRRTNMANRYLTSRPKSETLNKLVWVKNV